MTDHERLLTIAHQAVDHAVTLFNGTTDHELTAKGDRDYATETDYRIERELRDRLAKATPDIGFLGEEAGHTGSHDRWWCLDPIDGTVNYVHGNPLCGDLTCPGRRRRTDPWRHRPPTTRQPLLGHDHDRRLP